MLSKVATTPRGNNSTGVEPNIDQGHNLNMAKKPTLDEMRLALTKVMPTHQREANKAKFLEPSKVKERLYHGTNKDIKSFKAPKNAVGIWATKNPDVANEYATISARGVGEPPSVYPVHVRLKNPANKDQFGDAWDLAAKDSSRLGWNTHDERHKKILQDQGFDGAILDDSVVVFDHKHIKSAIGNRGTYDINESDINKAKGGLAHMAEGGLTWNSPEWKPHPENDLLHPIGASKMVGDEKLLSQDNTFSHGLSEFPSSKKSYRYLYHGEDKKPIGSMQIQTTGPRSKKAVIQNLYVAEANRRQGIASKLLDRARQDFDVKHSTDLTTSGKAFAKAKKAKGGIVKYPSIEEMLQKLQEAGRTPIMPAPDRWFKNPEKHPYQQKAIEKLLEYTGHNREAFPHGAHINPITGEPLDFEIMHDLGVAIDPVTGTPRMSGIKSELTEIDPRLGSLTKSNLIRKGLFKHEGGDPLLDRIKFLATIEKSGKGHHYGLSTHYESPAELVQEMKGNPTLRPHSRGDIYGVGDEVGRISIKGKHHPVYEKLLVAPSGMDVQGKKLHKAKGGITHAHHLEIEERPL